MRRVLALVVLGLGIAALILYAADYASVRFGHDPFGTVIVTRYYVIPQKNGKTEFVFQPRNCRSAYTQYFPMMG